MKTEENVNFIVSNLSVRIREKLLCGLLVIPDCSTGSFFFIFKIDQELVEIKTRLEVLESEGMRSNT